MICLQMTLTWMSLVETLSLGGFFLLKTLSLLGLLDVVTLVLWV